MTGVQKWRVEGYHFSSALTVADGVVYGTDLTLHTNNGNVYFPDGTSTLHAFDAITGKTKWNLILDSQVFTSPIVDNGVIYVAGSDVANRDGLYRGTLYALTTATGSKKWEVKNSSSISSSPTVVNGIVYIGINDEKVYALDAQTGEKKWATPVDGILNSSPCVVTSRGGIYQSGISGAQP